MIKNIILDMGNVLLDFSPDFVVNKFCSEDEEREIIKRELFCGQEWVKCDLGLITDEELFECVKKRVPEKYHNSLRLCVDKWDVCMTALDGARDFCRYAKKRGYKLYLLSNASKRIYDYFESFLPFDFFDGYVISCDVHIVKPDKKIYQLLLDKYNLIADECLFIDDREDNVLSAQKLKINTYQFENDFESIISFYKI